MSVVKTEWWFDDASLAASRGRDVFLARERVHDDGTADILLESGDRLELASEAEADEWLSNEEYRRISALYDDLLDEGATIPALDIPGDDQEGEALLRRMRIVLPER